MAKKNSNTRKATATPDHTVDTAPDANEVASETMPPAAPAPADTAPPAKTKTKVKEELPSSNSNPGGSIGISDIRKAVAFSNSVGGLENAIALLQILKVAKEVQ